MSASRRGLLAAPLALAATPAAAGPCTSAPSCFDLGLRFGTLIKLHGEGDRLRAQRLAAAPTLEALNRLEDQFADVMDGVLETPARSVEDVLAKLVAVLCRIHWVEEDNDDLDALEQAAEAVRDCIVALARRTGTPLARLGAGYVDLPLQRAIRRGEV